MDFHFCYKTGNFAKFLWEMNRKTFDSRTKRKKLQFSPYKKECGKQVSPYFVSQGKRNIGYLENVSL